VVADELSSEGYKEESFALYRKYRGVVLGFAAAVWCGVLCRGQIVCVLGGTGLSCRVYTVKRDCFYMWALARAISLCRRVTNSHVHYLCSLVCTTACCTNFRAVLRCAYCFVA
jgi:hypothetical protein